MKGKRVGKLQDIDLKSSIYVKNRIRKDRVKGGMGKPKLLLQVLWKHVFMGTYKDLCNYYTLHVWEDNDGNTIIETSLRDMVRNCLNFIEKETLLQTNACNMVERILLLNAPPSDILSLPVKALSTHGVMQIIITENYNWIRRKVSKFSKNCPRGHIKIQPYYKAGFYVFWNCTGIYHCIQND